MMNSFTIPSISILLMTFIATEVVCHQITQSLQLKHVTIHLKHFPFQFASPLFSRLYKQLSVLTTIWFLFGDISLSLVALLLNFIVLL